MCAQERRGSTALEPTPLRSCVVLAGKSGSARPRPMRPELMPRRGARGSGETARERHRWGSAPTPRSALLVGRRPTLTASPASRCVPMRHRSDTRRDPNAEQPLLQNRSWLVLFRLLSRDRFAPSGLTHAPVWVKKCIKGFFANRRRCIRGAKALQAAWRLGLIAVVGGIRVGSDCSAL